MDFSQLKFDANGLIPAIAQDARTNQVLMLAYMNQQSIEQTLETGYATYFSRSRQALWKKGETSGHTQRLVAMRYDCDHDAMLLTVEQVGPACHTGAKSCFFNDVYVDEDAPATANVLQEDYATIADRAANPVEGSYTNYLLDNGVEKICVLIRLYGLRGGPSYFIFFRVFLSCILFFMPIKRNWIWSLSMSWRRKIMSRNRN